MMTSRALAATAVPVGSAPAARRLRPLRWRALLFPAVLLLAACASTPDPAPLAAADNGYRVNEAIQLAGSQVPEDVASFYFVVIDEGFAAGEAEVEVLRLMRTANESHEFLGITGPNAQRNLAVMQAALGRTRANELQNLEIIYLGPHEHVELLRKPLADSGAGVHFMVYPSDEAAPDTQAQQLRRIQ